MQISRKKEILKQESNNILLIHSILNTKQCGIQLGHDTYFNLFTLQYAMQLHYKSFQKSYMRCERDIHIFSPFATPHEYVDFYLHQQPSYHLLKMMVNSMLAQSDAPDFESKHHREHVGKLVAFSFLTNRKYGIFFEFGCHKLR